MSVGDNCDDDGVHSDKVTRQGNKGGQVAGKFGDFEENKAVARWADTIVTKTFVILLITSPSDRTGSLYLLYSSMALTLPL
jgi:hypothetical protein